MSKWWYTKKLEHINLDKKEIETGTIGAFISFFFVVVVERIVLVIGYISVVESSLLFLGTHWRWTDVTELVKNLSISVGDFEFLLHLRRDWWLVPCDLRLGNNMARHTYLNKRLRPYWRSRAPVHCSSCYPSLSKRWPEKTLIGQTEEVAAAGRWPSPSCPTWCQPSPWRWMTLAAFLFCWGSSVALILEMAPSWLDEDSLRKRI